MDECTASVSGIILEDTDEDGDGDEPIVGVAVTLIGADCVVVGTTMTGTDGTFVFDGVPLGTYTVVECERRRRSKLYRCSCGTRC